jgi:hypothetical protein
MGRRWWIVDEPGQCGRAQEASDLTVASLHSHCSPLMVEGA